MLLLSAMAFVDGCARLACIHWRCNFHDHARSHEEEWGQIFISKVQYREWTLRTLGGYDCTRTYSNQMTLNKCSFHGLLAPQLGT